MRSTMRADVRTELPALIPWVSERGMEDLIHMDMSHLLWMGDRELLEETAERHRAMCAEVANEGFELMQFTAEQVMAEYSLELANMLYEVVDSAPVEQYAQVAILKGLAADIIRSHRTGGSAPEAVIQEATTIHYLLYTVGLMNNALVEREVH